MEEKIYGIRELSELAGVSARTLRYYDEIGLLKPRYTKESGYRFYGAEELDVLWQILFYRERGFELKEIKRILYQEKYDVVKALEEQLSELEEQKKRLDALIRTVRQTILSRKKGERTMNEKERFEALKERAVRENEERYGEEIRKAYGDRQVEASNQRICGMSKEAWERFHELEEEIREKLEQCVLEKADPHGEAAKELVRLHREWLSMAWPAYSVEAHKGVAAMYVCDERFRQYYDAKVEGCAAFLEKAVRRFAGGLE